MQNSISLTRIEGGVALHPLSFSLSLDADSWTWSWSATLPQAAGAHLGRQADGEPPVLEAVINGQAVHLRLESRALDERFLPARWLNYIKMTLTSLASPPCRKGKKS